MNGRIIGITIICIIALSVPWIIYTEINGSPFGVWRTESIVERYLVSNYPKQDYHINNIYYNLKTGTYTAEVTDMKEKDKFEITIKSNYKFLEDSRWTTELTKRYREIVIPLVKTEFPQLSTVEVSLYPQIIIENNFKNKIKSQDTIWVDLRSEEINNKEQFADRAFNLIHTINKEIYFDTISLILDSKDATYFLTILADEKNLSKEQFKDKIKVRFNRKIKLDK